MLFGGSERCRVPDVLLLAQHTLGSLFCCGGDSDMISEDRVECGTGKGVKEEQQ